MTDEEALCAAIDKVNADFDDAGVSGYMAHLVLAALSAAGWTIVRKQATGKAEPPPVWQGEGKS